MDIIIPKRDAGLTPNYVGSYFQRRKHYEPHVLHARRGRIVLSDESPGILALCTTDLTNCSGVAVYGSGLAVLAHAYSIPIEGYVTIENCIPEVLKEFGKRGIRSKLKAKLSVPRHGDAELFCRRTLKTGIEIENFFVSSARRNVIFDTKENMLEVFTITRDQSVIL